MATEIFAGLRVEKSEENPYGWIDVDLKNIDLERPTVFCISGDATCSKRDANAMAKYANKLLGRIGAENASDVQIVSVYFKNANRKELTNSRTCLREKDKSKFTAEEQNPQYVQTLYMECFRRGLIDKRGQKRSVEDAQKTFRNITFLDFCHGDFVVCKLDEYMREDMKSRLGYQMADIDGVCKQLCAISIVPQDKPKKYGFSKIGFASMDDYHYASEDAGLLTDEYELDCNETSVLGIVERQRECRAGRSRLMYIDNLLDYNSIEDKHNVWLGRTEKLHQMDVYTDMNYQNEFGVKSKDAENFSLMIARALQNAVSNSCENKKSAKLVELDVRDIFKNRKAAYKQGTQDLNAAYLNPNVENIAWEAQERGAKIDESLYPQTMSQQSIQVSRGV